MLINFFQKIFTKFTTIEENPYHPLVWINGKPKIGNNVYIGAFSIINAKEVTVTIGDNCDIASYVSINSADSHKKCIGLTNKIDRENIVIGNNVFIGSHCVIKGGAIVGNYCVIAAGTIVDGKEIPEYSLVSGNPMVVKQGYYKK
jgi:acetyltransferase-like isoleucine patch superfamily enzyme